MTITDSSNVISSSELVSEPNGQQQQLQEQISVGNGKPDPPVAKEVVAAAAAAATNNHRTGGLRIRPTRSKSAPSQSSSSAYRVLFSTPSKYDRWMTLILSIPLLVILVNMISLWVANANMSNFERSTAVWCLGWTLVFVGLVYMLVLPKQVDIRSNGTIGVKTFLITYQFGDICHVYPAAFGRETMMGARIKFATSFSSQLVIRRRSGKWDVLISPLHEQEFLQTLQSVITRLEVEAGRSSSTASPNSNNVDATMNDGAPHAPVSSLQDPPVSSVV